MSIDNGTSVNCSSFSESSYSNNVLLVRVSSQHAVQLKEAEPPLSTNNNLAAKLRDCCIRCNVPRTSVTNLLHLHPYHIDLLLDYRTLLKTHVLTTVMKKIMVNIPI